MTFSAHISGKSPMKRKRLPAYTIPWRCGCEHPDGMGRKVNPGYLVKCIDCGTDRPA